MRIQRLLIRMGVRAVMFLAMAIALFGFGISSVHASPMDSSNVGVQDRFVYAPSKPSDQGVAYSMQYGIGEGDNRPLPPPTRLRPVPPPCPPPSRRGPPPPPVCLPPPPPPHQHW